MNPTWPRGYQRKGTAQYYLNQHDEAIETYKEGLKQDPNNAELQKNLKEVQGQQAGQGQPADMNAMMQLYMKLMNHPETKDLLADPSFAPILSSIMSNPTEAFKHMQDPRVQKVLKVLQENVSPDEMQKAQQFMNKTGAGAAGSGAAPKQE